MSNFWQQLKKPFTVLAPMADVTDHVFREIISELAKPDVLFTEFVSTDGINSVGKNKIVHKLKFSKKQRPIVGQIWGANPKSFSYAAKLLNKLKYDGVDINMGCPHKAVMKKNSGAALINNHSLVSSIVKEIRKAAPNLSLSIKTRLDKSSGLSKDWFKFLLSLDIDALTIHGRTAKDMSKCPANWNEIGKAVKLRNRINPNIAIIGNGDIKTYSEVIEMHNLYKVDGVMIGRGIFNNPWIFEKNVDSVNHSAKEYLQLLSKHSKLFHDTWKDKKNFAIMKKFIKVYIKDFKGSPEVRHRLMTTKTYKQFERILNDLLV